MRPRSNDRFSRKRILVTVALWETAALIFFWEIYDTMQPAQQKTASVEPFDGTHPHLVLILSYQRCGSSFLGDLFGRHPDVMYIYEPLDGLYTHLYGTLEGWNVPSDITNYFNGTARVPPQYEIQATADLLHNIFSCNIGAVPTTVLYNKFWKLFAKQHISVARFLRCSSNHHLDTVGKCRKRFLSGLCPDRFNPDDRRLESCHSVLEDVRMLNVNVTPRYSNYFTYARCLDEIRSRSGTCDEILKDICRQRAFVVVKTVRATMDSVEELIIRHRNLRVIHLIRDPRAVVVSRMRFRPSSYGLYSTLSDSRRLDLVKEAKLYCSTVVRDITKRRTLQAKYPGIIQDVVYEDLVTDLSSSVKKLYNFISIRLDGLVSAKVKAEKKTTDHATKWWWMLSFGKAKQIKEVCSSFYDVVSHKWP